MWLTWARQCLGCARHSSRSEHLLEKPHFRTSRDESSPTGPGVQGWAAPVPWLPRPPQRCQPRVFACLQGVLHHHGEVGHQHQGRGELAEPGAERVPSHPLRRHHRGLHKGTGREGTGADGRKEGRRHSGASGSPSTDWPEPACRPLFCCHRVDGLCTAAEVKAEPSATAGVASSDLHELHSP